VIQVLGLAIVAAAALYIALPLVRRTTNISRDAGSESLDDLLARRETLYREVTDLQFDRGTGKVSDAEYREQREECLAALAALVTEIDARGPLKTGDSPGGSLEAELEDEIRRLRRLIVHP
jgi:hypothetical protein